MSVTTLPSTSAAVNIQIIEPKNFPNGAQPGQISQAAATPPAPTGNPQADLQNAYQNAVNARNQAQQALDSYTRLAGNLNGQAGQQAQFAQSQQQAYAQQQQAMLQQQQAAQQQFLQQQQAAAQQAYQQQAAAQQQQQQQAYAQQQQAYQQQQQQAYAQQQQQQQAYQQQLQQQQAQQQAAAQQQQAQAQQQQPQQPPAPQGLESVPVEQLNMMIAQPQTLQEKVDAMEELAVRGQGSPETFELLKREAGALPPGLTGPQADEANYVRQAALWTLGMLNRTQNAQTPAASLPGLATIEQIVKSKNENPDVKAAAVQALQVMNRTGDPAVQKILKAASKDKNPDVKGLAQQALSGGGAPAGAPAFSGLSALG